MSLFNNIQENVIDTAEQMIKVVEEGVAILTGAQINGENLEETTYYGHGGADDMTIDEEDLSDMKSPLDGIAESVLGDLMKNQAAPVSMKENFDAFRSAITWSEPFILSIIAFQIVMILCSFIVTRHCGIKSRLFLLSFMACVVRSAEWCNNYGSRYWGKFATQNYFDEKGIFISLMLSAPLLIMTFFMLISFLREASGLLVEVKKHEMKQKKNAKGKKRRKQDKKED